MKRFLPALAIGLVASLAAAAIAIGASGAYTVSAVLTPKSEVPAPKAPAGAKGTFTGSYKENKAGGVLTWKMTFSGMSGPILAAHIHKAKRGVAGAVIVPLCGPCKNGMTGRIQISKAVISALESGGAYVNLHTKKNAAGEVRGQVAVKG